MKTLLKMTIILLMLFPSVKASCFVSDTNIVVATFKGVTEEGRFEFLNEDNQTIFFDEVIDEIEIDLYEDEYINIKFSITWIEEDLVIENEVEEEEEEEGNQKTGEVIIKKIVKLEIIESE